MAESNQSEPQASRQMTFGQKAVGIGFNPSSIGEVHDCKSIFAEAIDQMHNFRESKDATEGQKRHASIAITEIESAQMRAVKALTWKD